MNEKIFTMDEDGRINGAIVVENLSEWEERNSSVPYLLMSEFPDASIGDIWNGSEVLLRPDPPSSVLPLTEEEQKKELLHSFLDILYTGILPNGVTDFNSLIEFTKRV